MIKPARIRFDDAIVVSSNPKLKGKEVQKFLKQIRWCENTKVLLTPAVLCQDTEKIPGAIEALQELNQKENVELQLHGWDHKDYGSRSEKEIEEHLEKSFVWFQKNLDIIPTMWMTPHGANSLEIQRAANNFGLIVEDTSSPVIDIRILEPLIRKTRNLKLLKDRVIMTHFWEKGLRLWRIARFIEHQNIKKSIEVTKSELDKKAYKICWKNWIDEKTS